MVQAGYDHKKSVVSNAAQNFRGNFFTPLIMPKLSVNEPGEVFEQEADAVADRVMRMNDPLTSKREGKFFTPASSFVQRKCVSCEDERKTIQRKVIVDPPAQTGYIVGLFAKLCPQAHVHIVGNAIKSDCKNSGNFSCDCVCDVTNDPDRTYTIKVVPQCTKLEKADMWNGSKTMVPFASPGPSTSGTTNPEIIMNPPGSIKQKYGFFDAAGKPRLAEDWRILGHELFGHGRLQEQYEGSPGKREGHDTTIKLKTGLLPNRILP